MRDAGKRRLLPNAVNDQIMRGHGARPVHFTSRIAGLCGIPACPDIVGRNTRRRCRGRSGHIGRKRFLIQHRRRTDCGVVVEHAQCIAIARVADVERVDTVQRHAGRAGNRRLPGAVGVGVIVCCRESFKSVVDAEAADVVAIGRNIWRRRPAEIKVLENMVECIRCNIGVGILRIEVQHTAEKQLRAAVGENFQIAQLCAAVFRILEPAGMRISAHAAGIIARDFGSNRPIIDLGSIASASGCPCKETVVCAKRVAVCFCAHQPVNCPNLAIIIHVQNRAAIALDRHGDRFGRVIVKSLITLCGIRRNRRNRGAGKRRARGYRIRGNNRIGIADHHLLPEQHGITDGLRRPCRG